MTSSTDNDFFGGVGGAFGLSGLAHLSDAQTRSISAENFTGEKGKGGMSLTGTALPGAASQLGQGWKVSPSIVIQPGTTVTLAEIDGPAAIQHIWLTTHPQHWRTLVLRFMWDDEEQPSIEVPVGDFFCNGWGVRSNVNSLPVAVNPAGGFNSYWPMPCRRRARVTMTHIGDRDPATLYYQITYTLTAIPDSAAYLHAQWRRTNPLPYLTDYTILDGVQGQGHYVGTYLAVGSNNNGWWGEGEIKFFLDGDGQFPTICGTGTEDYFGGAWNWEETPGKYSTYSTPFLGFHQLIQPDHLYISQQRFGLYRWHVMDPIRFRQDLRVTIQALGWRSGGRYLPRQDDFASVAFWYQREPHAAFPPLPDRDYLEVI
jgi:hypothetical protein